MSNEVLNEIENKFVSYISNALDAVKMVKDPEVLNRYRKLFKQHVPITMRSYVAAYLAKEAVSVNDKRLLENVRGSREIRSTFHSPKPKIVLSDEESKVLFFGIGRKRGVSPKDIITLVMQNVPIVREHIGEIKILDNYCFVQIMNEDADNVVSQLNDIRYRGRPLSVSYATKTEKDDYTEKMIEEEKIED